MPSLPTPRIAIIGSGPAGCYLAQSLVRSLPGCELTLFDRLPSPFGLIRYGIAADHQHTKAITRQFERLFAAPNVRFAGDVAIDTDGVIGADVTLAELQEHFDAVVFATGLSADRALTVPGGTLPGVVGAGALTRVLNAHPDTAAALPELGADVVIVGAGNVALDVLRFLVKDKEGYAQSDVADTALAPYLADPAQRITILSRSDVAHAKGDPQMFKELAGLERGRYTTDAAALTLPEGADRTTTARVAAVAELTAPDRPAHPGPNVTLHFGAVPVRIEGTDRVTGVTVELGGVTRLIPATAVITAIGFDGLASNGDAANLSALPAASPTGRIRPGVYRTGWAKRGPNGAIPENRACAKSVAEEIVADLSDGTLATDPGKFGFGGLPARVQDRAISFAQWQVLDAHECATARPGRVRTKLPDHTQMAAIARGAALPQAQV